jgi:hypothetical protein
MRLVVKYATTGIATMATKKGSQAARPPAALAGVAATPSVAVAVAVAPFPFGPLSREPSIRLVAIVGDA